MMPLQGLLDGQGFSPGLLHLHDVTSQPDGGSQKDKDVDKDHNNFKPVILPHTVGVGTVLGQELHTPVEILVAVFHAHTKDLLDSGWGDIHDQGAAVVPLLKRGQETAHTAHRSKRMYSLRKQCFDLDQVRGVIGDLNVLFHEGVQCILQVLGHKAWGWLDRTNRPRGPPLQADEVRAVDLKGGDRVLLLEDVCHLIGLFGLQIVEHTEVHVVPHEGVHSDGLRCRDERPDDRTAVQVQSRPATSPVLHQL
mmetsp:Transcript_114703/g.199502  ORF Transcript_114703/g.199502 Transcript_114703/m.199502 type:complete len:251 (-) Transcript_114703:2532-3284(-)